MSARYIVGDVRDVLATIPDGSIDLVLTSPPFLALRSYLPADHPDKHREIGSEPDPATFLDTLLALSAEWRRVLAPHGSICVELGDTYSSGGGSGYPLPKSLCGIPHLYHLSLAYGRNLLTGAPSPAGQWRVRNVVAWCRPNPPVGALGDKFRPATSYLTIACMSGSRFFDLDAVRTPSPRTDNRRSESTQYQAPGQPERKTRAATDDGSRIHANAAGAPPLDYWVIPTQPYAGAHYAAFPPALCERPIESMVPHRVCTVCGEPSRRIVDIQGLSGKDFMGKDNDRNTGHQGTRAPMPEITRTTIGWTDCGHDAWRPGVVLDPFAGSGTTLMVASGHGRDSIGIDIDERNAELALERVGPLLLTVEHLADGDDLAAT